MNFSRLILPILAAAALSGPAPARATGSIVRVKTEADGTFTLLRNGQPFYANGAGGTTRIELLKECGANSFRTWGVDPLEAKGEGKPLLDRAQELGLAVTVGLGVHGARSGFDYTDEAQLQRQRDTVRGWVRKYKDHPALLVWGLGNEVEGAMSDGLNPPLWKELNVLAGIIKEEDPNHPVMTVIAGPADTKVGSVLKYYPQLDILGVNCYGGAESVASVLQRLGWKKPFMLTEFGPNGPWEVRKTPWGAAFEQPEREKVERYLTVLDGIRREGRGFCLGTYAFYWGWKQEGTATWFGMFLESGEKLPRIDALAHVWSGHWPANRAPVIAKLASALEGGQAAPGTTATAKVEASDADGDALTYEWQLLAESKYSVQGGPEAKATAFPESVVEQGRAEVSLRLPDKPGPYRVFVIVRDGRGGACAGNFPFLVK